MDQKQVDTEVRFIDEAGDLTFFQKGKAPAKFGTPGISKAFMLGMLHLKMPIEDARAAILKFSSEVEQDKYFNTMPSIDKRIRSGNFFLHAKDDPSELRYKFLTFMASEMRFTVQVVVGRKNANRFVRKHNSREAEFYADLLSHLLKDKGNKEKLVLTIAQRGSATRTNNLEFALAKAHERHSMLSPTEYRAAIEYNVQGYGNEPILALIDYALWTVQRVFEKGESRHYDLLRPSIRHVVDLYDTSHAGAERGWKNYYNPRRPLTSENLIVIEED